MIVLVAALAVHFGPPSLAQIGDDTFRKCYHGSVPQMVIEGCSTIINSATTDKEHLAVAFKDRGSAYEEIGQYGQALEDFDRAIAINSDDWDAYNSRGTTRTALKRYALAIEDYDRAVRLNSDSDVLYSNRCYAKALLGHLEAALTDCNVALRIEPESLGGLASRGLVYLLMKRYDAAIADYDAELQVRFDDPYSLFGRGVAKYKKGDLKGADADFVHAQTLKPDIADHMASIGVQPAAL